MKACYSFKISQRQRIPFRVHLPTHFSESLPSKLSNFESQQSISRYGIRERWFLLPCWVVCLMATFFWKTGKFLLFPHSSLKCLLILALIPVGGTSFVLCLCFWCQLAHKCPNPKSPNPIQWTWTSQVSMSYDQSSHST